MGETKLSWEWDLSGEHFEVNKFVKFAGASICCLFMWQLDSSSEFHEVRLPRFVVEILPKKDSKKKKSMNSTFVRPTVEQIMDALSVRLQGEVLQDPLK